MNPLFTLGEEFRFHDSSRFRKKARDAKLRFYHSFVPVLMSLAAESCRSDKTIHCQRKHRKKYPPAMSQWNQHLTDAMLRKPATTTPKQFQTTWCFGKDWQHAGGARDLQSATVFSGILPFRYTCKRIAFLLKLRHFWQKKVTAAISFSGDGGLKEGHIRP